MCVSPTFSSDCNKDMEQIFFRCCACDSAHKFQNEIAPIALSNFLGYFVFSHLEDVSMSCLHFDLAFAMFSIYLCCANGVILKIGHVMDDVLNYHAHTLFAWSLIHVGNNGDMVTSASLENHLPPSHGDTCKLEDDAFRRRGR